MPKAEVKMIDFPRQQTNQKQSQQSQSLFSQNKIIDYHNLQKQHRQLGGLNNNSQNNSSQQNPDQSQSILNQQSLQNHRAANNSASQANIMNFNSQQQQLSRSQNQNNHIFNISNQTKVNLNEQINSKQPFQQSINQIGQNSNNTIQLHNVNNLNNQLSVQLLPSHSQQSQLSFKNFLDKLQQPFSKLQINSNRGATISPNQPSIPQTKRNFDERSSDSSQRKMQNNVNIKDEAVTKRSMIGQSDVIAKIIERSEKETDPRVVDNYEVDLIQLSHHIQKQENYKLREASNSNHQQKRVPQQIQPDNQIQSEEENRQKSISIGNNQQDQQNRLQFQRNSSQIGNSGNQSNNIQALNQSQDLNTFKNKLKSVSINNNHKLHQLQIFQASSPKYNKFQYTPQISFNQQAFPLSQERHALSPPATLNHINNNSNYQFNGSQQQQQFSPSSQGSDAFNFHSTNKNPLRNQFFEQSQLMAQNTNTTLPFTRKCSTATVMSAKSHQRRQSSQNRNQQILNSNSAKQLQEIFPPVQNLAIDQIVETIYDSLDKLRAYLLISIQDQEQKLRKEFEGKFEKINMRLQELEGSQKYSNIMQLDTLGTFNNLDKQPTFHIQTQQLQSFKQNQDTSNTFESSQLLQKQRSVHLISSGTKKKSLMTKRANQNIGNVLSSFGLSSNKNIAAYQNLENSQLHISPRKRNIGEAKTANISNCKSQNKLMISDRASLNVSKVDKNKTSVSNIKNNKHGEKYLKNIKNARNNQFQNASNLNRLSLQTLQQQSSVKSFKSVLQTQYDMVNAPSAITLSQNQNLISVDLASPYEGKNLKASGSRKNKSQLKDDFDSLDIKFPQHKQLVNSKSPVGKKCRDIFTNIKENVFQRRKKSRQNRVEIYCTNKQSDRKSPINKPRNSMFIDLDDKTQIQSPEQILLNQDLQSIIHNEEYYNQSSPTKIALNKNSASKFNLIYDNMEESLTPQAYIYQPTQNSQIDTILPVSAQPKSKYQLEENNVNCIQINQRIRQPTHAVISIKRQQQKPTVFIDENRIKSPTIPSKKLPQNESHSLLNKLPEYSDYVQNQANQEKEVRNMDLDNFGSMMSKNQRNQHEQNIMRKLSEQSEQLFQLQPVINTSSRTDGGNATQKYINTQYYDVNSANQRDDNFTLKIAKHPNQEVESQDRSSANQKQSYEQYLQEDLNSYSLEGLEQLKKKYIVSRNSVQSPSELVIAQSEQINKQMPRHSKNKASSNYMSAQDSNQSFQSIQSHQSIISTRNHQNFQDQNSHSQINRTNIQKIGDNQTLQNYSHQNQDYSEIQQENMPMLGQRIQEQFFSHKSSIYNEQNQSQIDKTQNSYNQEYQNGHGDNQLKRQKNYEQQFYANNGDFNNSEISEHQKNQNNFQYLRDSTVSHEYDRIITSQKINQVREFLNHLNEDEELTVNQEESGAHSYQNSPKSTIINTNQKAVHLDLDLRHLDVGRSVKLLDTPCGDIGTGVCDSLVIDSDREQDKSKIKFMIQEDSDQYQQNLYQPNSQKSNNQLYQNKNNKKLITVNQIQQQYLPKNNHNQNAMFQIRDNIIKDDKQKQSQNQRQGYKLMNEIEDDRNSNEEELSINAIRLNLN